MLHSLLQPMLIRWRSRNLCPCESPATMRCSKHGSHLCGEPLCIELHRWAHNSWAKDKETCLMEARRSPLDYAIYALAVVVTALSFVLGALYLGVKI